MLHMEEVRGVMRTEVMGNICQESRRFITRRLHHLALERPQGVVHARAPGIVISCLCSLLQDDRVTHGFDSPQTQTACKGLILGHSNLLRGHLVRQARALVMAVRHDGFFHATVALGLRPKGGANKSIESGHLQPEAAQANPTGANLHTHQVDRQDQSVQEGETGNAVKKRHDSRTRIEAFLIHLPRLQRATRHVKRLGRLTLGEAPGL